MKLANGNFCLICPVVSSNEACIPITGLSHTTDVPRRDYKPVHKINNGEI